MDAGVAVQAQFRLQDLSAAGKFRLLSAQNSFIGHALLRAEGRCNVNVSISSFHRHIRYMRLCATSLSTTSRVQPYERASSTMPDVHGPTREIEILKLRADVNKKKQELQIRWNKLDDEVKDAIKAEFDMNSALEELDMPDTDDYSDLAKTQLTEVLTSTLVSIEEHLGDVLEKLNRYNETGRLEDDAEENP